MNLGRVRCRKAPDQLWEMQSFKCVSIRDNGAKALLECCLKLVATEYRDIDKPAALIILLDRLVDDLPSGSEVRNGDTKRRNTGEQAPWQKL